MCGVAALAPATARIARAEDASRAAAEAVLHRGGRRESGGGGVHAGAGRDSHGPSDARSAHGARAGQRRPRPWLSVHTVFVLRYARLYYSPPDGGIDFHDEPPDYRDFAYLALTIGMSFQVSDTDLLGKRIRRVALHHALLSYVFATGIVAIAVSSVAALFGQLTNEAEQGVQGGGPGDGHGRNVDAPRSGWLL